MQLVKNQVEDREIAGEFDYIADRIESAEFLTYPFRHLHIENFLSPEHFGRIVADPQIDLPPQPSTETLFEVLTAKGYGIQKFPGCITDVASYLKRVKNDDWPVDSVKLEGFGMTWRLNRIQDPLIARLIAYMNGPHFQNAMERKFGIARPNRVETAIQKYMTGYEISPHPDIRSKCLTYLLNINTTDEAATTPIHTHLLKFKPRWDFIYSYWENHPEADRCWVPWDWCTTEKLISANNSIVMFAAHDRSLHAIKLRYDHTRFQRTQIYGNLWYTDTPFDIPKVEYKQFDIRPPMLNRLRSVWRPIRHKWFTRAQSK